MHEIQDKMALLFNHLEHQDDEVGAKMAEEILTLLPVINQVCDHKNKRQSETEHLTLLGVSFELPSDDIFDKPEVSLNNPLEEFYHYERPAYLEDDQKQFRERLQKALNYLKGN